MIFTRNENKNTATIQWKQLNELSQLNAIAEESNTIPVLIFKHSTRCSISRMSLKQFEREFDLQDKMKVYFLDLIEHRGISNEIATRFHVHHESPQIVLVQNNKSIYDASHESIDAQKLNQFV